MRASFGRYPPIGSLGAIGDGRSLALVGPDAAVEWFCPVRFDAAPLVWPLLDRMRGGMLRVGPEEDTRSTVRYAGETAVLEFDWHGARGRAVGQICMGWPEQADGRQCILWMVRGLAGELGFEVRFAPRPGFGRDPFLLQPCDGGVAVASPSGRLALTSSIPLRLLEDEVEGRIGLRAGETLVCCLTVPLQQRAAPRVVPPADAATVVEQTSRAWRRWASKIRWEGAYREEIVRSAIALKLLIYEPSGAVVAAGTTSLPEVIGGVRNWDYRYTWLRDASFTLNALYQLGCRREASRWARWMCRTIARVRLPLRPIYGVAGELEFPEYEVQADGYRSSRPVRVGNAAGNQLQLDTYGELLDCLTICEVMGDKVMHSEWTHFRRLADFVAEHWREPDSGIWEVRDRPRHFVYSKAMAWVALDRACRMARKFALDGDVERWMREAGAARSEVLARGIVPEAGHLGRSYGEAALDASLLLLPIVGFLDANDPVAVATTRAVGEQLRPPGAKNRALLLRYPPAAGDGLPGAEGAFTLCSFWLVEALALAGRWDDAEELFQDVLGLRGALGLYAEEIDPISGEQLGNFPQAFTHIGLINAALRLRQRSAIGRAVDDATIGA